MYALDVLTTAAAFGLICFLLCLPAFRQARTRRYALGSIAFVVGVLIATDLRHLLKWIPRIPGSYNWTGKLFELLFSAAVLWLLIRFDGWRRQEFGLTLSFNPGTGRDVLRFVVPFLLLEIAVLWFLVPAGIPTLEDHLFQVTTPGITEELAFRGVLLALLDRAFPRRVRVLGADLGWSAVVTSVLFGLWHGFALDAHLKPSFDIAPMVIPMAGGFVLAWSRARSGTLLLPVMLHAGMNEFANLLAVFKAHVLPSK
jgi:membrane protease YdiL (CAAX protease family)